MLVLLPAPEAQLYSGLKNTTAEKETERRLNDMRGTGVFMAPGGTAHLLKQPKLS